LDAAPGATEEAAGWPPHEATATVTARRAISGAVLVITRLIGTRADPH
jgi:hypothetical protein